MIPDTPLEVLDDAVSALVENKDAWTAVTPRGRVEILDALIERFASLSADWARACSEAEGMPSPESAEEWLVGPYLMLRNLRLLRRSLDQIDRFGRPRIPGPVKTRPSGQVTARAFPTSVYDFLFFPGVTADVWMEPGVTERELPSTQALAYRRRSGGERKGTGKVALVLGAGNVSSIGPTDALYKFFVEDRVVLYKMHPVNAYLGPLIEKGFGPLVERGFLRVVYGGAEVGAILCEHPGVDEIHITGSDKTVEAIAFGTGEEAERRKAEGKPRNTKPIGAELGNVSGVIAVPGPWSASDLSYQAENVVSSLTNNGGFNCNATRVVVLHQEWPERTKLGEGIREALVATPLRTAYYPGAAERYGRFVEAHPEAETVGEESAGKLPWAFIPGLDPAAGEDLCFRSEAFCGVFGETALSAPDPAAFVDRAVDFANDTLWGTLNVTLLVHPASMRDPEVAAAVERAIENLRFGTVSVNHWAAVGFGLMTTTWGAYPGHDLSDVQSGMGVVHNTLMFSRAQKTVIRAPFKAFPKPPWFTSHGTALGLAKGLAAFEAAPSALKLPGIFWHGLRG